MLVPITILTCLACLAAYFLCLKKAPPHSALVRYGQGGIRIAYDSILVLPVIHRLEVIDLQVKRVDVQFSGDTALPFRDGHWAEIEAAFFLRVPREEADIKYILTEVGADVAMDEEILKKAFEEIFLCTFLEICSDFDFSSIYSDPKPFTDRARQYFQQKRPPGFVLEKIVIDKLKLERN